MNIFHARLALVIVSLLQFSTSAFAGSLDDYYLQQFGESNNIQLQKAILSVAPEAAESASCGMPLKHGLKRDWNLLEQATQKVLAKQLALPALAGEATFTSTHFKVHYATTGTDAPPLADNSGIIGVPDWVETVADTFENVYASYGAQGYQPAPTTAGTPYDIYLLDLSQPPQQYYGLTTSNRPASSASYPNAFTSWMELDNNFTDSIYKPDFFTPLQSLQITAAHEYHHAIQYGYNFYFDIWYAEATSTWMEDELYDDVNQLYSYIPPWFIKSRLSLNTPANITTGGGYGRWIFNRYLAEIHTPVIVRNVWENAGGRPRPVNTADIPMIPVLESILSSATYNSSLGNEFFGFVKRVYNRDWTANPHSSDTARIHPYAPVSTYDVFPADSNVVSPTPSTTLPHYSFAYYKFTPKPGVLSLTITLAKSGGIQKAAFKKSSGVITEISADAAGGYTDNSFNSSDEVVLLIANTTNHDGENVNISTDGTLVLTATTTPPPTTTPVFFSSGGGGGGCFIATAAYGSYLHPQVQLLRTFRDDYLLTNAPGRAFVALYYRCSPPLADFIARHTLLRCVTRLALTPLIVAITHPLIAALSLFLFLFLLIGAVVSYSRRIRAACTGVHSYFIRTTSSRL